MDFSLIETMRWQPGDGFVRVDQHLRRLARSADALGFRQPQDPLGKLKAAAEGETPLRVRLTMNFRGKIEVTTTPVPGTAAGHRLEAADRQDPPQVRRQSLPPQDLPPGAL